MAKADRIICPLMGGKECIEDGAKVENGVGEIEIHACRFWVVVQGKHPQTGADINTGDCAMAWQPILMLENSKVNRETGAAVEGLRNENVTTGQQITQALMSVAMSRSESSEAAYKILPAEKS